ncbi:MAG: helix-turn-helix domain-containing protein [Dehalococcoidia bacterium]
MTRFVINAIVVKLDNMENQKTFTLKEAAEILFPGSRNPPVKAYRLVREGKITAVREGRRIHVEDSEIFRIIMGRKA